MMEEVLVVDHQLAFNDHVLKSVPKASLLRKLSMVSCYSVSDEGLQEISICHHLCQLNISYCHLVSDVGVTAIAKEGLLHELVAKGCLEVTDRGIIEVAKYCTSLMELDLSGCWQVTNKSLYALQENLLHMRTVDTTSPFSMVLGGTAVDAELAVQFAAATGSSISLHNLSSESFQADLNLYLPQVEEEDWYDDDDGSILDVHQCSDYLTQRAEDWLVADDPALFSDEFSEPEEWGPT